MRTIQGHSPRRSHAFTLIELLLVLVILAVLAAIVAPKFTGRSEQAKVTAADSQISAYKTALDMFELDNGRFPTSEEGLRALIEKPNDAQGWKQPYIDAMPDDPWQNEYRYKYPGDHNEHGYDLYSMGPDKQDGTQDDIVNWDRELRR